MSKSDRAQLPNNYFIESKNAKSIPNILRLKKGFISCFLASLLATSLFPCNSAVHAQTAEYTKNSLEDSEQIQTNTKESMVLKITELYKSDIFQKGFFLPQEKINEIAHQINAPTLKALENFLSKNPDDPLAKQLIHWVEFYTSEPTHKVIEQMQELEEGVTIRMQKLSFSSSATEIVINQQGKEIFLTPDDDYFQKDGYKPTEVFFQNFSISNDGTKMAVRVRHGVDEKNLSAYVFDITNLHQPEFMGRADNVKYSGFYGSSNNLIIERRVNITNKNGEVVSTDYQLIEIKTDGDQLQENMFRSVNTEGEDKDYRDANITTTSEGNPVLTSGSSYKDLRLSLLNKNYKEVTVLFASTAKDEASISVAETTEHVIYSLTNLTNYPNGLVKIIPKNGLSLMQIPFESQTKREEILLEGTLKDRIDYFILCEKYLILTKSSPNSKHLEIYDLAGNKISQINLGLGNYDVSYNKHAKSVQIIHQNAINSEIYYRLPVSALQNTEPQKQLKLIHRNPNNPTVDPTNVVLNAETVPLAQGQNYMVNKKTVPGYPCVEVAPANILPENIENLKIEVYGLKVSWPEWFHDKNRDDHTKLALDGTVSVVAGIPGGGEYGGNWGKMHADKSFQYESVLQILDFYTKKYPKAKIQLVGGSFGASTATGALFYAIENPKWHYLIDRLQSISPRVPYLSSVLNHLDPSVDESVKENIKGMVGANPETESDKLISTSPFEMLISLIDRGLIQDGFVYKKDETSGKLIKTKFKVPPVILSPALVDKRVSASVIIRFIQLLQKAGVEVYAFYHGGSHADDSNVEISINVNGKMRTLSEMDFSDIIRYKLDKFVKTGVLSPVHPNIAPEVNY